MFISFTHRMSSFIPTEREREGTMSGFFCLVQLGVLFFYFLGWWASVCVRVRMNLEANLKYSRCPSLYN